MSFCTKFTAALTLLGAASAALAQTSSVSDCYSPLSSYEYYLSIGDRSGANQIVENHPQCFGGSSSASNLSLNATAFSQASAISGMLASRLANTASGPAPLASNSLNKGMAAGGQMPAWNVWGNVGRNDSDFHYTSSTSTEVRGSSEVWNSILGADYMLTPQLVVGLSAAFDNGKGWGQTAAAPRNNSDTDGFLIAPYLGYQLTKELVLDVTAGFGQGKFSADGGVKAEADRWYAATNLSYNRWLGNLQLTGKLSYLHGEEDYGNTEVNGATLNGTGTTNKLDQVRLGGQLGYWTNGFMPYVGLAYSSNVHRSSDAGQDPLGRDTWVGTLGVNYFSLSSKVSGGIYYAQEIDRQHSDNQMFAANINFRF